ncbi:hypothetical protein ACVWYH_005415 [Bradyrhizobium sp. GM24.11]
MLLHALVHSADIQDRDGGVLVMATLFGLHPFLLKLYADGGYQGPIFQSAVRKILRQIDVEIVKRSDTAKSFAILPKRSCASPQSASCCESSAKKQHDPGQTLRQGHEMRETRWLDARVEHAGTVERFSAKRVCLSPIRAAISLVAPTPRNA